MDLEDGERVVIQRLNKISSETDRLMSQSKDLRRQVINTSFMYKFESGKKSINNPIWDPEFYKFFVPEEPIRYITPEAAYFILYKSIINLTEGSEPIPYDPKEIYYSLSDVSIYNKVIFYAMNYVTDRAFLRQIRKGIIWSTIIGSNEISFETDYTDDFIKPYKSKVFLPSELNHAISYYEKRKSKLLLYNWSIDISNTLDIIYNMYKTHIIEIETYYGHPFCVILAFYDALNEVCHVFLEDIMSKNHLGIQVTKRALLDKLVVNENYRWRTRFEEGLNKSMKLYNIKSINFKSIYTNAENIIEDIIYKYALSYRNIPDLDEFLSFPSILIETQENTFFIFFTMFNKMGASIFETPLKTSGKWLEFKGTAFEDYCHETINTNLNLKTFTTKIKNQYNQDIGDIDLGILKEPYIIMCECKNYALNTKYMNGEYDSVISRIETRDHGYLGWLSKIEYLCDNISYSDISSITTRLQSDINNFTHYVPIILTWRPEFILEPYKIMLNENISRVCTLDELLEFLKNIPEDFHEKEFIKRIEE